MIFLQQGYTDYMGQVAWATKFCTVTHNIYGSKLRILLYVTFMVLRILRLLIDFFENLCTPFTGSTIA